MLCKFIYVLTLSSCHSFPSKLGNDEIMKWNFGDWVTRKFLEMYSHLETFNFSGGECLTVGLNVNLFSWIIKHWENINLHNYVSRSAWFLRSKNWLSIGQDQASLLRLSPGWLSWTGRQLAVLRARSHYLLGPQHSHHAGRSRENFHSPFNKKWMLTC